MKFKYRFKYILVSKKLVVTCEDYYLYYIIMFLVFQTLYFSSILLYLKLILYGKVFLVNILYGKFTLLS